MERKRPLIAAIFPAVHDDCQSLVWPGAADYLANKDAHLMTFVATSQNKVETFEGHYHIVATLLRLRPPDGVLVYTGAFSDHFDAEGVRDYCTSLGACPIVCIHQKVPGLPSVLIDNTRGVREAVRHLATEHGCRSFAFIKGIENHLEAEARYAAFCAEIAALDIPQTAVQVFPGHFIKESGMEAARIMVAQGRVPDAVVAVNDSTALGVLHEFSKAGVRVPGDVRVVGFDDVPEARNHVPTLTTVRQPLRRIGSMAAETLVRILDGDRRDDVLAPTEFLPRQSCGCFGAHIDQLGLARTDVWLERLGPMRSQRQFVDYCASLLTEDCPAVESDEATSWIETLLEHLKSDIRETEQHRASERFLVSLASVMADHISAGGSAEIWQQVITVLSSRWRTLIRAPEAADRVEDILSRSRMCVSDLVLRMHLSKEAAQDEQQAVVRAMLLSLITAFDLQRVTEVLRQELPRCGITACHLVLYDTDTNGPPVSLDTLPAHSRLLLSFIDDTVFADGQTTVRFSTAELLPQPVWEHPERKDYLVFPIVFERHNYGYALFRRSDQLPLWVYEDLRIHIGNALRGHFLVHQLRDISLRDELTGLYNRRGFSHLGNHLLSQARRLGHPVAIMYGDLNKLKYINDNFGHLEGDYAIAKAAELLQSALREQDVLARIGGDEFAVMASGLLEDDCRRIIARIEKVFADFNARSSRKYPVSISVGYAVETDVSQLSIDQLIERADTMLGKIKRSRPRT